MNPVVESVVENVNHLSEDCLEIYLLGRFPGQLDFAQDDLQLKAIEEHVLVCTVCVGKAEAMEATIAAIREALLLPTRRKAKPKVLAAGGSLY